MPLINEVNFSKVGTNQINVRIDDGKIWFTICDYGNPQEPFFVLDKEKWNTLKRFVDGNLITHNFQSVEVINPETPLLQ